MPASKTASRVSGPTATGADARTATGTKFTFEFDGFEDVTHEAIGQPAPGTEPRATTLATLMENRVNAGSTFTQAVRDTCAEDTIISQSVTDAEVMVYPTR
jgi:hypothetical protein